MRQFTLGIKIHLLPSGVTKSDIYCNILTNGEENLICPANMIKEYTLYT